MGYVGIPVAILVAKSGFRVIGFDINKHQIDGLNNNKSSIKHIPDSDLEILKSAGFYASDDFIKAAVCDVLIICVPHTAHDKRTPDTAYLSQTETRKAA